MRVRPTVIGKNVLVRAVGGLGAWQDLLVDIAGALVPRLMAAVQDVLLVPVAIDTFADLVVDPFKRLLTIVETPDAGKARGQFTFIVNGTNDMLLGVAGKRWRVLAWVIGNSSEWNVNVQLNDPLGSTTIFCPVPARSTVVRDGASWPWALASPVRAIVTGFPGDGGTAFVHVVVLAYLLPQP